MKIKTGIDIANISRFREMEYSKNSDFYSKLFDVIEIEYCLSFKDPYPHFTGKFAVKEAIKKALNTRITFLEIHTRHGDDGEPKIESDLLKDLNVEISISHDQDYAVAIAILFEN
jgi:holo-[acyl-carrier protein] synthase